MSQNNHRKTKLSALYQKLNGELVRNNIGVLSILTALPDLPLLPSSLIAGTCVAGERLWQRNIPLPIKKQYGIEVIIFYKTQISETTICPT